jgi:hypothetical protein
MDDVKAKIDQRNRQLDAQSRRGRRGLGRRRLRPTPSTTPPGRSTTQGWPCWTPRPSTGRSQVRAAGTTGNARTMSRFFHRLTWRASRSTAIDSTVRTNPSDSPGRRRPRSPEALRRFTSATATRSCTRSRMARRPVSGSWRDLLTRDLWGHRQRNRWSEAVPLDEASRRVHTGSSNESRHFELGCSSYWGDDGPRVDSTLSS